MQGKRQGRCVMWIINWALPIHCNTRAPLVANTLVSEDWMERDDRGLQKLFVLLCSFCILRKSFARPFELCNFLSLYPFPKKTKILCFWFQTMKNDWVWRKVFERFITILNISVDIIRVLFFQLVSILEKLDSKFESFFTEELKIYNNTLIRYLHLFILNYPLQYSIRLVT